METSNEDLLSTKHDILATILTKIDAFPHLNSLSFAINPQKIDWLQRFLALKIWLHDTDATILSPPYKVDELWHEMVLHTRLYRSFQEYMEIIIDHDPNGKSEDAASRMQRQERYEVTKRLWIKMYGRRSWDAVKEDETTSHDTIYELEREPKRRKVVATCSHDNHRKESKEIVPASSVELFIDMRNGTTIALKAPCSALVKSLKQYISRIQEIAMDDFNLVFDGERLMDDKTLSSYDIENKSTLDIVSNLRGC
jgi:hypothetical protein